MSSSTSTTDKDDTPEVVIPTPPKPKHVLVIGGGFAGLATCVSLRKVAPEEQTVVITVVEPKEFFEVSWCAYRTPFDEVLARGSTFLLAPWATKYKVHHIQATVTSLTTTSATLSNGTILNEFDVCVIGTGATTQWPALGRGVPASPELNLLEGRLEQLSTEGKRLLNARHVLIVGGGLIGVELAADIKAYAKLLGDGQDVKVTLVHAGEFLCHTEFSKEAAAMAQSKLEALGVKVILNDRAEASHGTMALKSTGEILEGIDEVVLTVGLSPINKSFIQEPTWLDDKGWIQVDEYLSVQGNGNDHKKFFALGDCCTYLPNAASQILNTIGQPLGKNIMAVLDGKLEALEKIVPMSPAVYAATIGTETGVVMTPYFHTQYILPWIKNATMFLFKAKGDLGL
jgi:apoptosis-inducing factor 2